MIYKKNKVINLTFTERKMLIIKHMKQGMSYEQALKTMKETNNIMTQNRKILEEKERAKKSLEPKIDKKKFLEGLK